MTLATGKKNNLLLKTPSIKISFRSNLRQARQGREGIWY